MTKRLLALFIMIALLFSSSVFLVGCGDDKGDTGNNSGNEEKEEADLDHDYKDKIVVPEYKEYPSRNTINFSEIKYSHPDFDTVIEKFENLVSVIESNEISFEDQLLNIKDIESDYSNIMTMYSFANIYNSKDASESYWNQEFSYIKSSYPKFADAVEEMFVAAANSPHAERFEDEYFGDGLIEEYKDGGKFSDTMVALWAEEERLEAEYSSISTATIVVTYKSMTDTVDNIKAYYLNKYGEKSQSYAQMNSFVMTKYEEEVNAKYEVLLVDLLKVRKLIANELGDENYLAYAYKSHSRDYTPEKMSEYLDDIVEYVIPVYATLNYYIFSSILSTKIPGTVKIDELINNSYSLLQSTDEELADIFAYMLQFDLYDIEKKSVNRQDGAFTTYLDNYDAPFIFMSASRTVEDYSTLFHEFGHFADSFVNYDASASLDLSEVSSQGLEYIMLHHLDGVLASDEVTYLKYLKLSEAFEVLLYQGFYARFEEYAYKLDYDEITLEKLNETVKAAADNFKLNSKIINNVSYVSIPHIFLYPFYVQSYCTSVLPALELYLLEGEEKGAGLAAYKILINRNDENHDFEEALATASLTSPFEKDVLRKIANDIYFSITGSNFYTSEDHTSQTAA